MVQETVAIDLDDVVVETAPKIIEYYNQNFDTDMTTEDFYTEDLGRWQTDTKAKAVERIHKFLNSPEYLNIPPVEDAISTISALKRVYKLVVITGRPHIIEEATKQWVKEHFPDIFKDVVHSYYFDTSGYRSKGELSRELGASILIDDHLGHILEAAKNSVKGLLFGNYPWNQTDKLPPNVKRVNDWHAVARELL